MIDLDSLIAFELDRMFPLPSGKRANWQEIVDRAVPRCRRAIPKGRLVSVFAAATMTIVLIALATPVGAAIVRGLDDFAAWISGQPGQPASPAEQQEFQQENERSWSGFPPGTELRRLIKTTAAGMSFKLYGFRSGDELCLRLVASGAASETSTHCAPVQALQMAKEPALVIAADEEFGSTHASDNEKGFVAPPATASFGIVSDGVAKVLLRADDGTHEALVGSNAFLYVADHPRLGLRIRGADAVSDSGSIVALSFESRPFGLADLSPTPKNDHLGGPSEVDRSIQNGRIGWIEAREPRGHALPAEVVKRQARYNLKVLWGRLIQPDPDSSDRFAVEVAVPTTALPQYVKAWEKDPFLCVQPGICGASSEVFKDHPLYFVPHPVDQFDRVSGLASDDVSRVELYLGTGDKLDVPLRDNIFFVRFLRAAFPVRFVAYDSEQRVIDVQYFEADGGMGNVGPPPEAEAGVRERFRVVAADGSTAIVMAGDPVDGRFCYSIVYAPIKDLVDGGCTPWPVDYSDGLGGQDPLQYVHDMRVRKAIFLSGVIAPEVSSATVSFPDGTVADATIQDGFLVYAFPPAEADAGRVTLHAYDRSGKQIAERSMAIR